MNCSDVSLLLDGAAGESPSAAADARLQAHLRQCAACARQWLVAEQLAAFRTEVPPLPVSLRQRAAQLQELGEPGGGRVATRRPVIFGSLLLFGATALFGTAPWREPSTAGQ
jgi:hypothetical protein